MFLFLSLCIGDLSLEHFALQAKCCGVDGYTDFTGASQWIITYPPITLQTPLSCCKTLPSSTDFSCASAPTTSNNYLNEVRRHIVFI